MDNLKVLMLFFMILIQAEIMSISVSDSMCMRSMCSVMIAMVMSHGGDHAIPGSTPS